MYTDFASGGNFCGSWKKPQELELPQILCHTISGVEAESWIMNHGCKTSRNHEFSRLKPWNHESREIVKGIMNHERIIPSIFEAGDYNHLKVKLPCIWQAKPYLVSSLPLLTLTHLLLIIHNSAERQVIWYYIAQNCKTKDMTGIRGLPSWIVVAMHFSLLYDIIGSLV